jgi:hypothetical protein
MSIEGEGAGKGDTYRPVDREKFCNNFDAIDWSKKSPSREDSEGHFIDEKCPKCGSSLLGNKLGDKWCSFVGGASIPACDYGLR